MHECLHTEYPCMQVYRMQLPLKVIIRHEVMIFTVCMPATQKGTHAVSLNQRV